jgi:hypothetical protein
MLRLVTKAGFGHSGKIWSLWRFGRRRDLLSYRREMMKKTSASFAYQNKTWLDNLRHPPPLPNRLLSLAEYIL